MRLLVLLAIAGMAYGQEVPEKNPRNSAEDVHAGGRIFRAHCAECHGLEGEGGRGPNLTTGEFLHGATDADLYRNVSNGISGTEMPGVFFERDQVWQIVAYVRSLSEHRAAVKPKGDAARGAALFKGKGGCLGCHLVRGEGGVNGPDLSRIGSQRSLAHLRESILEPNDKVDPRYWVVRIVDAGGKEHAGFLLNEDNYSFQVQDLQGGLKTFMKAETRKYWVEKKSVMPRYRSQLSEAEVDDLVAYLWSLRRERRE